MANFLELSHISKRFGGVQALADVDLTIERGAIHCLVGENGSGKSTLLKIIAGVEQPDAGGRIAIDGHVYPHLSPTRSGRAGIHVIYQDLSLFANLSVAENIAIASHLGRPHLVKRGRLAEIAQRTMTRIGVALDPRERVGDLPIAARQLVAICRALAADARLLIMDEPTASLTRHEVDALLRLAIELKRRDIAIIFVSHRLDEVLKIAERVSVLRDGRKVGTFEAAEVDHRKLALLMTGKEFRYETAVRPPSTAPVVLEVRDLSRAGEYRDVTLAVREGEILGITGLLGAGRTELALSLFGMNPPDAGEIRLNGRALALRSNREAIQSGIAYVSEDRLSLGLILAQPIATNIIITVMNRLAARLGLIQRQRAAREVERGIDDLAIKVADPGLPVKTLSGGNQQRVVLAKWLATSPRLLILDSPTVGVDISAKDGIYEIVRRLAARGIAVLLISDEIPEVLYHCHRIMIMRKGRIGGEFMPHQTSEAELEAAINA